ncbi:hypothetical protein F5X99DRAFT_407718 [Biscogniauxia marginata]|nr:hypothetical protein F5X99DRAFT_407718 [Biscogniauxia marginata]
MVNTSSIVQNSDDPFFKPGDLVFGFAADGEYATRLAPKGVDVYYDNVGGEQLETALTWMNDFWRIVQGKMKEEVTTGIESIAVAWVSIMNGDKFGKLLLKADGE